MNKQKNQAPLIEPKQLSFRRVLEIARDFGRMEAAAGILLIFSAIAALIIANSRLFPFYDYVLNVLSFQIGFFDGTGWDFAIEKSLLHWVNDGLMALFFFLVGLEIKEEMAEGSLSSPKQLALPALAALGGIIVPACIYFLVNRHIPENFPGWAIPTGTDIAFALCMLSLLGKRVPLSLKVFLTAIAILDDIAAIICIALFYSQGITGYMLALALLPLLGLFWLNKKNVAAKTPYLLLAVILWMLVLESGVHATLAGVLASLFIPLHRKGNSEICPNSDLQKDLHPWVAFLILPLFGLANAGVPLDGISWKTLSEPMVIGISLGLFLGKQTGIFLGTAAPIWLGWTKKAENTSWLQIYGMSVLCGIGFTMSLFIGSLAFVNIEMQANLRIGVLLGSVISAITGYSILRFAAQKNE